MKLLIKKLIKFQYINLIYKFLRVFTSAYLPTKIFINDKSYSNSKKVLIFTSIGGHTYYSRFDRFLERCFNLLGYEVIIILCNGTLNLCQEFTYENSKNNKINDSWKKKYCNLCYKEGIKIFANSNVRLLDHFNQDEYKNILKDFITFLKKKNTLTEYKYKNINFGEHINSAIIRYYGGYLNIDKDEFYITNLIKFAKAAIKTYLSVKKIILEEKVFLSILHHGIYIPQGIISDVLNISKLDFYTYSMAYRDKTFYFSKNITYHKKFLENNNSWKNFNFGTKEILKLKAYFKNKIINNQDWIDFTSKTEKKKFEEIKKKLEGYKKDNVYIMYTNVSWDAQAHFENNVFINIYEWLDLTLTYFKLNPDKILIIRAHPAEIKGNVKSSDSICDYVKKNHNLNNLILIYPSSRVNSYDLFSLTDNYLIYSSKISIELLYFEKNVLIAGEAFVRGKGFTLDVIKKDNYFEDLNNLVNFKLTSKQIHESKKYIFYFFFKLMIEVNLLIKSNSLQNRPYSFYNFNLDDLKNDKAIYNAVRMMLNKREEILQ